MIILRDLYEGEEEIFFQGYQIEEAKKAIKQRAEGTCGEMFLHINVTKQDTTIQERVRIKEYLFYYYNRVIDSILMRCNNENKN